MNLCHLPESSARFGACFQDSGSMALLHPCQNNKFGIISEVLEEVNVYLSLKNIFMFLRIYIHVKTLNLLNTCNSEFVGSGARDDASMSKG